MKLYTADDVLAEMERQIAHHGSVKEFAKRAGVTAGYITHIRTGRRDISGYVLRALGFERAAMYQKVRHD